MILMETMGEAEFGLPIFLAVMVPGLKKHWAGPECHKVVGSLSTEGINSSTLKVGGLYTHYNDSLSKVANSRCDHCEAFFETLILSHIHIVLHMTGRV